MKVLYRTWKCKKCNLRWESYDCADRFIGYICQLNNMSYYYDSKYLQTGIVQLQDEEVANAVATIYGFYNQDKPYYCDKCRLREMDTDDVYRCKLHHNVSDCCSPSDGYA